ncbi:hypothetical protein HK104_011483 [Borealophlyctis nickersoniae]|nr:hypothetical protein HK104_011483 [Borealophlyctis nickersoniae]
MHFPPTAPSKTVVLPLGFLFGATHTRGPEPRTSSSPSAARRTLAKGAAAIASARSRYCTLHGVTTKGGKMDRKPGIRQVLIEHKDVESAAQCVQAVQAALARVGIEAPRPTRKKILVLVNPYGGIGEAVKVYKSIVAPMFRIAGCDIELIETNAPLHATKIAQTLEINQYSAAVTVSGDGVFHEVLNGLLTRPDWDEARKLPLGFIPAGSSNAMARNLNVMFPELATLAVIKARNVPMDVFSVTQNGSVTYSHLQVMWTFLADLDIESDRYRWIGRERFTVAALIRLIWLRTYRGTIYYLPAEGLGSDEYMQGANDSGRDHLISKREGFHAPLSADATRASLTSATSNTQLIPGSPSPARLSGPTETPHHGPPRLHTAPDSPPYTSWPALVDSPFSFFIATNLPWISADFLTSPSTRLNDGSLHLIWAERISRWQCLQPVLDQGTGAYLKFPYIRSERVRAFVLDPKGWTYGEKPRAAKPGQKQGILDVSGEEIPYGPIKVEVHPGVVNVIAPEWLDEDEWTTMAM